MITELSPRVRRQGLVGILTALLICGGVTVRTYAQSGLELPTGLRVAVAGSEPFVMMGADPAPMGLSIDVWQAVAQRLNIDSDFIPAPSIAAALEDVISGEADVAVGPISITAARAERVAFTQPYFNASLAILAPATGSLLERFTPFMSRTFLVGIVVLTLILCLVGMLIWLAERRTNPGHFPESVVPGVGNGIWMALVTMTTVGYGDRVPASLPGRVVTGIWMLLSLVIASSLTAFLATALTLSQIAGPSVGTAEDLRGARVGVVAGTTSETFAADSGARLVPSPDLETAVAGLENGETDAIVFDRPVLRFVLGQRPDLDLRLSDASYQPQNYGFALRAENPLTEQVNLAILQLQEDGELARIEQMWLGR